MESLRQNTHFVGHHPDTLEFVRKAYNLQHPGRIDEAVDRLQDWVKAQPHFNKRDFSRHYLETFLINNKGLVEKTKRSLERNMVMKTFGRQFFSTDTKLTDLKDIDNIFYAGMPKLTKDHIRIYMVQIGLKKFGPQTVISYIKFNLFILEMMLKWNYSMGVKIILDLRNMDISTNGVWFNALRDPDFRHGFAIHLKGYKLRIHSIHLITTSKLIQTFLAGFKTIVSEKILSRIQVHKTVESLYEYFDRDLLPSDYGGKEKSLKELSEEVRSHISADVHMAYLERMFKATVDISKKPITEYNDEYMGIEGTFRTLYID